MWEQNQYKLRNEKTQNQLILLPKETPARKRNALIQERKITVQVTGVG